MLPLLDDESSAVRYSAAAALVQLGNTNSKIVNILLSLLSDKFSYVRNNAALLLGQLGNGNSEVVSSLLLLLGNKKAHVSNNGAAIALAKLAKTSDNICPKVVKWLEQNPNHDGIGIAIDCLWSIVVE